MKILTTQAAMAILGPTWRGETRLFASGPVIDGVLHGDLVLQGLSDLDLDADALRSLFRRARQFGLRSIKGNLIIDRSFFQPSRTDIGAQAFDELPEFPYNVIPDAALVNNNVVEIEFLPENGRIRIVELNRLRGLEVESRQQLVPGDCRLWRTGWQIPLVEYLPSQKARILLRGNWPDRCGRSLGINLVDRDVYIRSLVAAAWGELGGEWEGKAVEGRLPEPATLLADHTSRQLSELLPLMNKPSGNANVLARTLFLAIGAHTNKDPAQPTVKAAEDRVRTWLKDKAMNPNGLVLENGSGLSRAERITAQLLAQIVHNALDSSWAPEFLSSLSIAGVDGTLGARLRDSPATGVARFKTGTLRNAVSVAGVMKDGGGTSIVVTAIINRDDLNPEKMRPILDEVIDLISRTKLF